MTTEDDLFEQRFTESFKKRGKIAVPPLAPERKAALIAQVKAMRETTPTLSLTWRRIAESAREVLEITKTIGVQLVTTPAPMMRDSGEGKSRLKSISWPFEGGVLHIQIAEGENRRVHLSLSITGEFEQRDDVSVELSVGEELVTARSMEKKTELAVDGTGTFRLDLFAGEKEVTSLQLPIGEDADHD